MNPPTEAEKDAAKRLKMAFRNLATSRTGGGGHTQYDTVMRKFRNARPGAKTIAENFLRKCGWVDIDPKKNNHTSISLIPHSRGSILSFIKADEDEAVKIIRYTT